MSNNIALWCFCSNLNNHYMPGELSINLIMLRKIRRARHYKRFQRKLAWSLANMSFGFSLRCSSFSGTLLSRRFLACYWCGPARIPASTCDGLAVACPKQVVFFDFLLHEKLQNANIRAFENAFISLRSHSLILGHSNENFGNRF